MQRIRGGHGSDRNCRVHAYWFPGVPGWVWIVGFSSILVAVNAFNVKVFGAVEYAFSSLKVTAIVVFIVLGGWLMMGTGISNYTAHGGFFPKGVWGMWVAVIVAIFSYLSIEMNAVAAGEADASAGSDAGGY